MSASSEESPPQDGNNSRLLEPPAEEDIWKVNSFRMALPQVLATMAQSLLLLMLGMMVGMPTIVIAALLNAPGNMSMNGMQASWFAGVIMACQPLGSVMSGPLSEGLGRKRCMLVVTLPTLAGWLLMHFSANLSMLYIAAVIMGFSIGFMEAPSLSYVGEVTQPSLRARMCSLTSLNVPVGYLVMYLLGTVMDWRSAAACSTAFPILTALAISQLPESPHWLLRKDRKADAEAALCWLRGWVGPEDVQRELASLQAYCEKSILRTSTRSPQKGQVYIEVPRSGNGPRLEESAPAQVSLTLSEKLKDLARPEMLRPLRLVVLYFFFYHCGGLTGLRPFMVTVFQELRLTVDPYWLTVASASMQIIGAVCCLMLIHRLGKRLISLISMGVCAVSLLALGTYTYYTTKGYYQPVIPMALFGVLFFFTNLGIAPVPWALISEVFPPRGKAIGGAFSSALYYMMYFVATKTFLDLVGLLGLHGVFFVYASLALVGFVYIDCFLPETEGHRLEDIEKFFQTAPSQTVPIN